MSATTRSTPALPELRARLDALVQSAGVGGDGAASEDEAVAEGQADAPLVHLRAGPGRASVASLRGELARLETVRRLGLPENLFADWSAAELEACRQRVAGLYPAGTKGGVAGGQTANAFGYNDRVIEIDVVRYATYAI